MDRVVDSPYSGVLYVLQQALNGTVLGCIYALLAVGFSLVYGIIGRINFAFGELLMLGAYQTVIAAIPLVVMSGAGAWALPVVLLIAAGMTAGQGWAVERLVFRPLRGTPTHVPLIAAIGASVFLQELVRLLQGARDRWLAPGADRPLHPGGGGGVSRYRLGGASPDRGVDAVGVGRAVVAVEPD